MNIIENILTKNDCYKLGKKITPIGLQLHTIGTQQNSAASLASYWNQTGVSACVHYCVDAETTGKVLHFLPDNYRSWADGNFGNGNLITVELMESDYMKYTSGANYTITNDSKFKADITRAYNTAVEFFAYKCKEYGWDPQEKMSNGLYRVSSHDEGRRLGLSTPHVDPTHIWPKIGKTMDDFRADVKAAMDSSFSSTTTEETVNGMKLTDIAKYIQAEFGIASGKNYNCLLGVAQCMLDIYTYSNPYKKSLSDSIKANFATPSTTYTAECLQAAKDVFVNGKKRFDNAKILQYRSFSKYSDGKGNPDKTKCASLLSKYTYIGNDYINMQYGHLYFGEYTEEKKETTTTTTVTYRVGTAWKNGKCVNQTNAYSSLANAKKEADKQATNTKKTYYVFGATGKVVYTSSGATESSSFESYMVRVTASALNIRKGPGTNYGVVSRITDKGAYTIIEESNGWGRLKSKVGWINLGYTKKI